MGWSQRLRLLPQRSSSGSTHTRASTGTAAAAGDRSMRRQLSHLCRNLYCSSASRGGPCSTLMPRVPSMEMDSCQEGRGR